MTGPLLSSSPSARAATASRTGPLATAVGGAVALAALVAAGVVAVVFAAALALLLLLALVLAGLAWAAARAWGGRRARSEVITARWTGYGWDAR